MLSDLSLDVACLVVFLGNGSGETTVCWNHDKCCANLQRVSGHVLGEILLPGCNDDGVVTLVRERLFVVQTMVTPYSTSSSGDPRRMRMRRNLSMRSTFCFNLSSSCSEMAPNSSGGGGDLAAVIMPACGNRQVFLLKTH